MKALFICNQNQHRSKTAEELFKDRFETISAGLYNENPVTEKDISWADVIFVMEEEQRSELSRRFPGSCLKKQIISLDIPDLYYYNQPQLIDHLKQQMKEVLPAIRQAVV
jgi:predicted protein tyrosine phosphatase